MEALDKIDRLILRTLQADGRATYDQLAEQVSLSPSAVLRRVKRLEEHKVIDRYVALVQTEAVGLGLTSYLNVRLEQRAERSGIRRGVLDELETVGAHRVVPRRELHLALLVGR